jgi:hypothetical protein
LVLGLGDGDDYIASRGADDRQEVRALASVYSPVEGVRSARTEFLDARLVPLATPEDVAEGDTAPTGAGEYGLSALSPTVSVTGAGSQPSQEVETEYRGPQGVEDVICSFDWDCDYWIAVAFCESSLRPSAVGYAGRYTGLYQVWLGHGYPHDWLLDPYNNTLAAWELSKEGTVTTPWPYCRYQ